MKAYYILLLVLPLLASCGNQTAENTAESPVDQKFDEVMKMHDDVMAQMGPLKSLQEEVNNFLSNEGNQDEDLIQKANAVLEALNSAEDGMMTWMHGFGEYHSIADEQKEEFLQEQEKLILDVGEQFRKSMGDANQLLGK